VIGWLLDTNVISTIINPSGAPTVKAWAASQEESRFFLSVLTLAEYDKGIHHLAEDDPNRARHVASRDALAARQIRHHIHGIANVQSRTVVGLFDFSEYDTGETPVSSGDLLVVFSDGLTEAVNPEGEEFGDDRLAAVLETVRGKSAAETLQAVLKAVTDFAGTEPPRDDLTVMVIRFN